MAKKRLIQAVNEALFEEMERDERVILFGEDVEISLFGDTIGLHDRFGGDRVRNTPISETVMTGMAVGMAAAGYTPRGTVPAAGSLGTLGGDRLGVTTFLVTAFLLSATLMVSHVRFLRRQAASL